MRHYLCCGQSADNISKGGKEQRPENEQGTASNSQGAQAPGNDSILREGCQLPPGIHDAGIGLPPGIKPNSSKKGSLFGAVLDLEEDDAHWGVQEDAISEHGTGESSKKIGNQCTLVPVDAVDLSLPPGIRLEPSQSLPQYHPVLPDSATQTPQTSAQSTKASSVEGAENRDSSHDWRGAYFSLSVLRSIHRYSYISVGCTLFVLKNIMCGQEKFRTQKRFFSFRCLSVLIF